MPPLLTARTCWRAGWVVIGIGLVLVVVSDLVASSLFFGQGPGVLGRILYSLLGTVTFTLLPGGVVVLIGSVVVRHVERLTDALVASGTIEALPVPSRAPQRRVDGAVDLDDVDADDVVEHEPGVR